MKLLRFLPGALGMFALLAGSMASADMYQPPVATPAHRPVPTPADPVPARESIVPRKAPFPYDSGESTQIRLVEETATVDIYPMFARVQSRFVFEGGPDHEALHVGCPSGAPYVGREVAFLEGFSYSKDSRAYVPLAHKTLPPMLLEVVVDGEKVAATVVEHRGEPWTRWPIDVAAGKTVTVEMSYLQLFFDWGHVLIHPLWSASTWRGGIDVMTLEARAHHIEPDQFTGTPEAHEKEDGVLRWRFEDLDPITETVQIAAGAIDPHRSTRVPEYSLDELPPHLQLLDEALKLQLAHGLVHYNGEGVGAERWLAFIESLIAADAGSDAQSADVARAVLAAMIEKVGDTSDAEMLECLESHFPPVAPMASLFLDDWFYSERDEMRHALIHSCSVFEERAQERRTKIIAGSVAVAVLILLVGVVVPRARKARQEGA